MLKISASALKSLSGKPIAGQGAEFGLGTGYVMPEPARRLLRDQ
jgi:hypothetical protein